MVRTERGAVRKKRPCCECRRWFMPDARVGDRQRSCGGPECRRAVHRRADAAWHARHPEYDRARRWQAKLDAVGAGSAGGAARRPPPLNRVPWDIAQDAMGAQACVIVEELAGLLVRHAQDEMRR
jgi:hypothetical protein